MVVSATQIGKTTACALWLLHKCWDKPGSRGWWVAPTYDEATIGFETILQFAECAGFLDPTRSRVKHPGGVHRSWGRQRIRLCNGSVIQFKSWEREDSLQGRAVHFMVVDEAGSLTETAREKLAARRSGTLGPVRYIGNATHTGSAFWRLCRLADADTTGHMRFVRWTWKHRAEALPAKERVKYEEFIEQQREISSEEGFDRLFNAEFLRLGVGILNIERVCVNGGSREHPIRLPYSEPWVESRDGPCIGGLDIGKDQSWTVLTIWGRKSGRLLAMLRIQQSEYGVQAASIVHHSLSYCRPEANPEKGLEQRTLVIFYDRTGVGNAVREMLRKESIDTGVRFRGVHFNLDNKMEMVEALQVTVQQRRISAPWIKELVTECETLERTELASGLRYKAAKGFKDDCVWSAGLAIWGRGRVRSGLPVSASA